MGFYEFMAVILVLGMILILLRRLVASCRKRKLECIQEARDTENDCTDEEDGC